MVVALKGKPAIQPASKATAAAPKLTSDMELGSMDGQATSEGEKLPQPAADIMHLARVGDIAEMGKLLESGTYDASHVDDQGITMLHWAAINNQYAMCKFLLERGSDVNKKGGDSDATPLQWAAQRSHYYTMNLLLKHGADPLIEDGQGYNALHISTFHGNIFVLILLLHQGIPVDVPDRFGHTGLMWSAYKGHPHCVDLFLRWGADVRAKDNEGFSALHWSLVKGSPACIQKLVEYGSDRFATTNNGKSPASLAEELNTTAIWYKALRDTGYDDNGHAQYPLFLGAAFFNDRRLFLTRFLFLLPFVGLWLMLMSLTELVVFIGLPMALLFGQSSMWIAATFARYGPADMRQLHNTPWLAGVFSASLFLVGVSWITTLLPATFSSHTALNLAFGVVFSLCTYFYSFTMMSDPGFVPKLNGISEQKAVIDELLSIWKLDEANFCVACMVRTPLRSKHCRKCARCVARHDHHCPWVYNCIGVNNHRHFFFYLINLTLGILFYDWIFYYYIINLVAKPDVSSECNFLSPNLCKHINADAYTLFLAIWTTLQLVWVSMLLVVQSVQVARGITTYESIYGVQDDSSSTQFSPLIGIMHTVGGRGQPPSLDSLSSHADGHAHHPHAHHHGRRWELWKKLLGIDTFLDTIAGKAMGGSRASKGAPGRRKRKQNPYSRGWTQNCADFWFDPSPVFGQRESGAAVIGGERVNYTCLYEVPLAGNGGASERSNRSRLWKSRNAQYERIGGNHNADEADDDDNDDDDNDGGESGLGSSSRQTILS